MSTKTRRELVVRVLENLFVIQAGETPSDEDYAAVDGAIEPALDELEQEQVVGAIDPTAIPSALFRAIAIAVEAQVHAQFSSPKPDIVQAKADLRRLTATAVTHEPLRVSYL